MHKRSSIIAGVIMIAVGALFLLINLFPALAERINLAQQWPLIVVAVGVFFLLGALMGNPELAIPGMIVSGIGGILYYQNATGNWASWAFVWALIPGFAGLGTVISGLLGHRRGHSLREGGRMIVVSAVLFAVFGAFFNGFGSLGRYWPVLLILIGLWMLVLNFLNRRG